MQTDMCSRIAVHRIENVISSPTQKEVAGNHSEERGVRIGCWFVERGWRTTHIRCTYWHRMSSCWEGANVHTRTWVSDSSQRLQTTKGPHNFKWTSFYGCIGGVMDTAEWAVVWRGIKLVETAWNSYVIATWNKESSAWLSFFLFNIYMIFNLHLGLNQDARRSNKRFRYRYAYWLVVAR